MAGYTNLVKVAMELIDDRSHLLREVSGVHLELQVVSLAIIRECDMKRLSGQASVECCCFVKDSEWFTASLVATPGEVRPSCAAERETAEQRRFSIRL